MSIDLHMHSCYSHDSILSVRDILKTAMVRRIDAVAITDHDTINGSIAASGLKMNGIAVINGAEIRTDMGDVIALFISEDIKSRDFFDVIDEINAQDGLIVLPHPFRSHGEPETMAEHVDIVETFNSHTAPEKNAMAKHLAMETKLPGVGGSDAHTASEIGNCVNILPRTDDMEHVRKMLLDGRAKIEGNYWTLGQQAGFRLSKMAKMGACVLRIG